MLETTERKKQKTQLNNRLVMSASEVLRDYRLAVESRQTSLIGRREVLSGKAKFGIFGDGKEVAQIAMARAFRRGDYRTGYYRDQTFLFAIGATTIQQFFAQLYAHADIVAEPNSGGRQMNSHFATRLLNDDGTWRDQTQLYNSAADLSPTASQMPRLVGLGYASRLYRELDSLKHLTQFSRNGDEVAFGTIGNASTAEGHFWEAVNAIGVLRVPVVLSIWDDEYGISVPNVYQLTKGNLSEILAGFQRRSETTGGYEIFTVKGWDYVALVETYARAAELARTEHVPSIIHVIEMTQPQGHSTSGSHERYKSPERLAWEQEYDCLRKMREWIIDQHIAPPGELDNLERNAEKLVENFRVKAWQAFARPIYDERQDVAALMKEVEEAGERGSRGAGEQEAIAERPAWVAEVAAVRQRLLAKEAPLRRDVLMAVREVLVATRGAGAVAGEPIGRLLAWKNAQEATNEERYGSHLVSNSAESALHVTEVKPVYAPDARLVPGAQVLNAAFEAMLARDPRVVAFGEDVGFLGGVNQTYAGLQKKYGELRVSDTGIREATIVGQAIGLALRGLRPIAEIQYLDYLLYGLQILSDDLASLHWRTRGGQKAPVIISTRGHRLEGIWHAGSPMAALINLLRGMHICVPRDMTQAAGFYNTLLLGDGPGLVVEVLNGYRLKEQMPSNIGEITVPLGVPEVLRPGDDITLVTYGASCRVGLDAAEALAGVGVDVEVIDVQTLLPFDRHGRILESLKKTGRIVFLDEDMPGGTTAYMMQQVIEAQGGYDWLDSPPRTIAARPHRPAYGTDGAYFSKPNVEGVFAVLYDIMNETNPGRFPAFL
ncbi:thiamine pyrophosphate-dependent enzyme [Promineifilum sp.]|uniref:alpha-ketoacid dehydrogenase subunit alpha/beta n=1 Tax=Promineifilum sp. TaxID=2664178 RepID=UPI0035B04840